MFPWSCGRELQARTSGIGVGGANQIRTPEGISQLLQVYQVNVLAVERAGVAGVELHIHATFEDEHGMGATLVGDQCVEVGSELTWRWEQAESGPAAEPPGD